MVKTTSIVYIFSTLSACAVILPFYTLSLSSQAIAKQIKPTNIPPTNWSKQTVESAPTLSTSSMQKCNWEDMQALDYPVGMQFKDVLTALKVHSSPKETTCQFLISSNGKPTATLELSKNRISGKFESLSIFYKNRFRAARPVTRTDILDMLEKRTEKFDPASIPYLTGGNASERWKTLRVLLPRLDTLSKSQIQKYLGNDMESDEDLQAQSKLCFLISRHFLNSEDYESEEVEIEFENGKVTCAHLRQPLTIADHAGK